MERECAKSTPMWIGRGARAEVRKFIQREVTLKRGIVPDHFNERVKLPRRPLILSGCLFLFALGGLAASYFLIHRGWPRIAFLGFFGLLLLYALDVVSPLSSIFRGPVIH